MPEPATDPLAGPPTGRPWTAGVTAAVAGLGGLLFGVSATQEPMVAGLTQPSPVIQFGIPVGRLATTTAGVIATGLAVLVLLHGVRRSRPDPSARKTFRAAGWVGAIWVTGTLLVLWLQAAELSTSGLGVSGPALLGYATHISSGRALLVTLAGALGYTAIATTGARDTNPGPIAGLLLALLGVVAVPLTGHAAEGPVVPLTMIAIALHVAGAALWVGGLAAIFALLITRRSAVARVLPRFSRLAGACIGTVAMSGLVVAIVRLTMDTGLSGPALLAQLVGTGYGWLVIGKTACLGALAGTGGYIRQRLLPGVVAHRAVPLGAWVGVELTIMAVALGLATALGRAPMS